MQALWSRAAQARTSCRCSSCLHAASFIARRTTTATSKRGLKLGDLFTACYSTILATAVFTDARVKEDRRKEWDRLIAEAKAGLPVDDAAIPKSTYGERKAEKLGLEVERYTFARRRAWDDFEWWPPKPESGYVPQSPQLSYWDEQLKTRINSTEDYTTVPGISLLSSPGQHEDWYDVDDCEANRSRDFLPREPLNGVHLDRMGEMVRNLVDQLLLKTNIHSVGKPSSSLTSSNLEAQRVEIAQQIENLRSSFVRLPAYTWDGDSVILQEQRTLLHKSLVTLCAKASPGPSTKPDRAQIELLVAKICYNLLISTHPPNIGTYNILMRELTALKQHDLVQSVVDSFLHNCKMRPNERTIKLILDHYHSKKDPVGFQDAINRMRASGGHMGVGAKTIYELCSPAVRQWAISKRIHRNGAWMYQKVDRTPAIFQSLFRASFDLKGLRTTIRFIRASIREGHKLPAEVFYRVVEACLDHKDYKAARRLFKLILAAWQTGSTSIIELSPDFRHAFYKLLALCNMDPSSGSCHSLSPFLSHHALQHMLLWCRIQSLEDSINRAQRSVLILRAILKIPLPQSSRLSKSKRAARNSKGQRIHQVLTALIKAEQRETSRSTFKAEHAAELPFIRIEALRAQLTDIAISTANIARDVESFRVRQSVRQARWEKIRDIEAKIASQVNLIRLQEYEVISLLSIESSVWYYETLTSRIRAIHAQGSRLNRPLQYAMTLHKWAKKMGHLNENEMATQNHLDAMYVEQQTGVNDKNEKNPSSSVYVPEEESNTSEPRERGYESAKPRHSRYSLRQNEYAVYRLDLQNPTKPSPPAVVMPRQQEYAVYRLDLQNPTKPSPPAVVMPRQQEYAVYRLDLQNPTIPANA